MSYWTAGDILKQLSGELGLPLVTIAGGSATPATNQLLAALNAAGNELLTFYPWEQFAKEWPVFTAQGVDQYALPSDWRYFTDQTQWDRTNHWPLLGPKSPQEWAYLKGSMVAGLPRLRFRVMGDKFTLFPVPGATQFSLAMEYISKNWVSKAGVPTTDMVTADGDLCLFDPWLLIKYVRLKFLQLKNFDTAAAEKEFLRVFETLTGKDRGAGAISLVPVSSPQFIGPNSIPDGNWNVNP